MASIFALYGLGSAPGLDPAPASDTKLDAPDSSKMLAVYVAGLI